MMKQLNKKRQIAGSALIMAIVLTVLLSVVGMMFIMTARMNKASTSSIIENKELQSGVESVVEIISQQLVLDTPGVDKPSQEYYDYPGDKDKWLASLEPSDSNGTYYEWRQISDITGSLRNNFGQAEVENVSIKPSGRKTILEYQAPADVNEGALADADGDGIADSRWIELENMRTSKGRKIYAAVRVIDNSAMLNVNTAYKFDEYSSAEDEIDGSNQAQINLAGLTKDSNGSSIIALRNARDKSGKEPWASDSNFVNSSIWNFGVPLSSYLPFGISDELELRYRFCIDSKAITRLENVWPKTIGKNSGGVVSVPYDGVSGRGLTDWQKRITDPNETNPNSDSDRRHLLTTDNLDRVIDPNGKKMFSVWTDRDAQALYDRLKSPCINPSLSASDKDDKAAWLAQICANIVDDSDSDANVSVVTDYRKNNKFYGFERPFIYISEIVRNFQKSSDSNDPNIYASYAVELYKNFNSNEKFDDWELRIGSRRIPIKDYYFEERGGDYYVIIYESKDSNASLSDKVKFSDNPHNGATGVDPDMILRWDQTWFRIPDPNDPNKTTEKFSNSYDVYFGTTNPPQYIGSQTNTSYDPYGATPMALDTPYYWRVDAWYNKGGDPNKYQSYPVRSFKTWQTKPISVSATIDPCDIILKNGDIVSLYRDVDVGGSTIPIMVDAKTIVDSEFSNTSVRGIRSYQRDISRNNRLKRLWLFDANDTSSLGHWNSYNGSSIDPIQPFHSRFITIGELGKVLRKSTYIRPFRIYPNDTEEEVRIDLHDPDMQKIFQYLTVMDPDRFSSNNAAETRVKGRLNINTAPKFLIQQLPWVKPELAEAIAAYRDMTKVASNGTINYSNRNKATGLNTTTYPLRNEHGFASVGELMTVINPANDKYSIQKYGFDGRDQRGFPDISTNGRSRTDDAVDDLEEKELIFARISDLATVRSDVFTAYILVRLGDDGPQKRVIAILDRSGVKSDTDKVKIRALQLVPDPR